MRSAACGALAALVMLGPGLGGGAAAQRRHRTGLWGELGAGAAHSRVTCSTCTDVVRSSGSGGYIRIGGVLSDRVLLGVESAGFLDEAFGFTADDTSIVAEMETITVVVLWFPWRSGVFLKGGTGVAQGRFTVPSGSAADTSKGTGIGMTLGLGLDWRVSRKFAVTANAAAFITGIGDVILPAGRVDDVIATTYHATIGVTIR
ncbi:MAG TPA: hypothetical protein VGA20_07400 [Gemmatimonadales bacterium]